MVLLGFLLFLMSDETLYCRFESKKDESMREADTFFFFIITLKPRVE